MSRVFFDPTPEQQNVVLINTTTLRKAERLIESCEQCNPADAEIPFDWLLTQVTGKRGPYEFMLSDPARCPNCKHEITEKTLVEPRISYSISGSL